MSGSFAGKVLADGQLPAAVATLYTATGQAVMVKFFRCHNAGSTSETVIIYVNISGTRRIIGRCALEAGETFVVIDKDDVLTLENGDTIDAVTTTATTVDYVITGVVET